MNKRVNDVHNRTNKQHRFRRLIHKQPCAFDSPVPPCWCVWPARERRNVNSAARGPNVAIASDHSTPASACGHSSSQPSPGCLNRSRRSCVTAASCHAERRAVSEAASFVPTPKPACTYGFMSGHHPFCERNHAPTGLKTDLQRGRTGDAGAVKRRCEPQSPEVTIEVIRPRDIPVIRAGSE
jgi:hypothetical protein